MHIFVQLHYNNQRDILLLVGLVLTFLFLATFCRLKYPAIRQFLLWHTLFIIVFYLYNNFYQCSKQKSRLTQCDSRKNFT